MDKSTFEKWICPNLGVILPKLAFVCVIILRVLLFFRNSHNFALWRNGEVGTCNSVHSFPYQLRRQKPYIFITFFLKNNNSTYLKNFI